MSRHRPRPINVGSCLSIITDAQLVQEIEADCSPEKPQIKVEGARKRKERERKCVNGLVMPVGLSPAKMVPIPLFREIKEDRVSKKLRPFELPPKYITYDEPTPDEEEYIIDYDMDSDDENFLSTLNKQSSVSSTKHLAGLKHEEFEALFDLFEKTHQKIKEGQTETLPEVIAQLFRVIRCDDMEDATCALCDDGNFTEDNYIIFCDGCDIAVHQTCYGLKDVPPDDFYCDRCKYMNHCEETKLLSGKTGKIPEVRCEFCPVTRGAFKPLMYINNTGKHQPRWAHVPCAMWIPECSFSNTDTLDPIVAMPVPSRNKHKCCVCNEKAGVTLKCSEKNCNKYFHVMCGRTHDFSIYTRPAQIKDEKTNETNNKPKLNKNKDYNGNVIDGDNMEFVHYCATHSLKCEIQRTDSHFGFSKLTDEELGELDAFVTASRGLALPAYSTELVYFYWRWRKKYHQGSFLRKFQPLTPLTAFFDKYQTTPTECIEKMRNMRQQFETLRILLDMIKKRELLKKDLIETRVGRVEMETERLHEFMDWWKTPRRSPRKAKFFVEEEEVDMDEEEQEDENNSLQQEEEESVDIELIEEQEQQIEEPRMIEAQNHHSEEDLEIIQPDVIEDDIQEEEELVPEAEEEVSDQPNLEEEEIAEDILPKLIDEPYQVQPQAEQHENVTVEQEDTPHEDDMQEPKLEFEIELEDQEIDYNVSSGGEHEAPAPTGSLPVTPNRNTVDSDSDVSGAEESYDSMEVKNSSSFNEYWENQERLSKLESIRNGFMRGGTIDEPIIIDDTQEAEEEEEEEEEEIVPQKQNKRKRNQTPTGKKAKPTVQSKKPQGSPNPKRRKKRKRISLPN